MFAISAAARWIGGGGGAMSGSIPTMLPPSLLLEGFLSGMPSIQSDITMPPPHPQLVVRSKYGSDFCLTFGD